VPLSKPLLYFFGNAPPEKKRNVSSNAVLLYLAFHWCHNIVTGRRFELSDIVEHFNSMLSIGHLASVKVHDFMAYFLEYLRSGYVSQFWA